MNKLYFDKIINDRIDEADKLGIKDSFVKFCIDKFYLYENVLKDIMSERKLQHKHEKFGHLSNDEKLELIKNFNIYQANEKEIEEHIYLVLSVKLQMEITYYIFYYIYYGKLYK